MVQWNTTSILSNEDVRPLNKIDSYVASAAREARSVAELAATKKEDKYSGLAAEYIFQPIAVETLGPINESPLTFSHFWPRKSVITPATSER